MITAEEIGTLVLRVQDDDVRPSDLRKFLSAVLSDEEVRRNARLAGKLSGLDQEVRAKHCVANVLFMLSHGALAPTESAEGEWHNTTVFFAQKFFFVINGPWRGHLRVDGQVPTAADISKSLRKAKQKRVTPLQVSTHLHRLLRALEEFWDVPSLLV